MLFQLWLALSISALAAILDVKKRIIPNWLTYSALLLGLLTTAVNAEFSFIDSILGLCIGFFLTLILYIRNSLGGGDLKLFAAMGAIIGYPLILSLLLWTCVTGFMVALTYTIAEGRVKEVALSLYETIVVTFINKMGPTPAPMKGEKIPLGLGVFYAVIIMLVFTDKAVLL